MECGEAEEIRANDLEAPRLQAKRLRCPSLAMTYLTNARICQPMISSLKRYVTPSRKARRYSMHRTYFSTLKLAVALYPKRFASLRGRSWNIEHWLSKSTVA